jgi:hypothetical protein
LRASAVRRQPARLAASRSDAPAARSRAAFFQAARRRPPDAARRPVALAISRAPHAGSRPCRAAG